MHNINITFLKHSMLEHIVILQHAGNLLITFTTWTIV